MKITIDTSSLNLIVKTDECAEEFFRILKSRDVILNIPSDCLMELANGEWVHDADKKQGVTYRLDRFVKLATEFHENGKILLNKIPWTILENETKNPGMKHTFVASERGANLALFATAKHREIYKNVKDAHKNRAKAKSAAKTKDKKVKAAKVISSQDAEQYLINFKTTLANPKWRDFLHSRFTQWIFGEKVSLEEFDKILNEENCGVIKAFINLLLVHHLAMFLDATKCSKEFKLLLEIEENSLPDILIASMAAYSDYFVCDDVNLRARCSFLKNLGLIRFETVTLADFVSA